MSLRVIHFISTSHSLVPSCDIAISYVVTYITSTLIAYPLNTSSRPAVKVLEKNLASARSRSPGVCEFDGETVLVELWRVYLHQTGELLALGVDDCNVQS